METAETVRGALIGYMSPAILWAVFVVAMVVFVIISVALTYHWRNYNVDQTSAKKITRTYFLVSGLFIVAMLVAAISYTT